MKFFRPYTSISALTFDLDDTLYDNAPYIQHAYEALNNYLKSNYPLTSQVTNSEMWKIRNTFVQREPALESDVSALRLLTLEEALKADIDDTTARKEAAQTCYDVFYHARSNFTVDAGVLELLEKLARRYPLVGITNGNVDVDAIGIRPFFNKVLHASVSRPMKPDRAMFDEAADILQLAPHKILHVGDNLEKDVFGAIDAGYQSAWHAKGRAMNLNKEDATHLPHIQLDELDELLSL